MVKILEENKILDLDPGYSKDFTGYYAGKLLEVEYFGVTPPAFVGFNSGVVTSFSDSFQAKWNQTTVVNKNDYVANYSSTIRSIKTGIILIAESLKSAQRNLAQAGRLVQFTYGTYVPGQDVPLKPTCRVKLMNLIRANDGSGLNGYLTEVTLDHDLSEAFYDSRKNVYPKYITINFTFEVLHRDSLGYDQVDYHKGTDEFASYPYAIREFNVDTDTTDDDGTPIPVGGTSDAQQKKSQVNAATNAGVGQDILNPNGGTAAA